MPCVEIDELTHAPERDAHAESDFKYDVKLKMDRCWRLACRCARILAADPLAAPRAPSSSNAAARLRASARDADGATEAI
jgi:hypothetical protein